MLVNSTAVYLKIMLAICLFFFPAVTAVQVVTEGKQVETKIRVKTDNLSPIKNNVQVQTQESKGKILPAGMRAGVPVDRTAGSKAEKKVLILYEKEFITEGSTFPVAVALTEFLGHFSVEVSSQKAAEWEGEELNEYDAVVYIGNSREDLSLSLLFQLSIHPCVIWFEKNIEQLAAYKKWHDFVFFGEERQFTRIYYRDHEIAINPSLPIVTAFPGSKGKVIAEVSNLTYHRPLCWQRENIFYIGRLDYSLPFSALLGEFLHEALTIEHQLARRVLLRIEDVSPFTDPENLNQLIDILVQNNVPYAVAVIPFEKGQWGVTGLSSKYELLKVLRRVPVTGGTFVMHGCFHSNEFSPQTGEGFEFWNSIEDAPMAGEPVYTRDRINQGLRELARAGTYPVAFEAPHYAMSRASYDELAKHFSVYVGQIQLTDETYRSMLELPFVVRSQILHGTIVYPEALGYYQSNNPLATFKIKERAKMLKVLRDVDTCVFYHAFLPPTELEKIIKDLKEEGYEFISLVEGEFWVNGEEVKIRGEKGKISVETSIKAVNYEVHEPFYRGPKTIIAGTIGLIALIFIVLVSFLIIIGRLRAKRNYMYEEMDWEGQSKRR